MRESKVKANTECFSLEGLWFHSVKNMMVDTLFRICVVILFFLICESILDFSSVVEPVFPFFWGARPLALITGAKRKVVCWTLVSVFPGTRDNPSTLIPRWIPRTIDEVTQSVASQVSRDIPGSVHTEKFYR